LATVTLSDDDYRTVTVRPSQQHGVSSWCTRLGLQSAVCSRFSNRLRPVPHLSAILSSTV